jgi:hypothetical protein
LRDQFAIEDDDTNVYRHILQLIDEEENLGDGKSKLTPKVIDEISRDLKRTHTSERMKSEEGQMELKRVLHAIGYVVPEVGYCQGMNFIASTLIGVLGSEETAFWIFLEMLITKDMKTLFLPVSFNHLTILRVFQSFT